MKYSGIGGQAVIEGIMMKNGKNYATAVRRSDGSIEVEKSEYISMSEKNKIFALPFIRGIFNFYDSMVLGGKCLNFSAKVLSDGIEEEPSKFEKFLKDKFGEKSTNIFMSIIMFFSVLIGLGIFVVLPLFLGSLLRKIIDNYYIVAIAEGFIRIGIFIIYIVLISRMEDIKRTFMYHGAEHKCISCLENGLELNVDNVMKSSKEHKRCGTSFIIIVMLISILFFMAIRVDGVVLKVISRFILIPIIAGVSYEFLRLAGKYDNVFVNILSRPGMWMQALTVKEPDEDMVEVAIVAVEKVFDWKTYLKENFD